jgi:hypothetical protein
MRITQIRCPICNGEVNKMWFSHRVGEYAFFIVECWSGDLHKKSYHHLFEAKVKLTKMTEDLDEKILEILKDIETELLATPKIANLQAYVTSKLNEARDMLGISESEEA